MVSYSIKTAGDELDEDIVNYVKKEMNLAIGLTTAEEIKKKIGCAKPMMTDMSMEVRGRDYASRFAKDSYYLFFTNNGSNEWFNNENR